VKETEDALEYLVHSLARMSEIHDDNSEGHIVRLGLYCELLAKRLNLSANFSRAIRVQVSLHYVGKIYLPTSMLNKTRKLTAEDWTVLKKHPLRWADIIGDHPRFKLAQSIALTHHERWDGRTLPQHFDPQALKAFKALSSEFEGIYTHVTKDRTK